MRARMKLAAFSAGALVVVLMVGHALAQSPAPAAVPEAAAAPGHAPAAAEPAAAQGHATAHEPVAAEAAGMVHPGTLGGHEQGAHGDASGHAESAHGAAGHAEAPPTLDQINWFYGFVGESDAGEPSLLYRPKGMPSPLLATFINWAIFVSLIVMLAKKQIPSALAKRKAGIVQGMNEAQKARDESAALLAEYENKLAKIDQDIERIKDEMRRAGEQERERILAEAVERRTRMERDARRLIETELEAAKETLRREIVQSAIASAKHTVESKLAASDQQRLFDEAMASLKKLPARSLGERA